MFHRSSSPFVSHLDSDSFSHMSPFASSRPPALDSYLPTSYDAYDLERSQLEQALLARRQQQRREAEAAAYEARRRHQLELERRAAIEQAIRDEYERREVEQALARRRHEEQLKRQYIEAIKARELEQRRMRLVRAVEEERERRQLQDAAARKRQAAPAQSRQAIDFGDFFRLLLNNSNQQNSHEEEVRPVDSATPTASEAVDPTDFLRQFFGASAASVPRPDARLPPTAAHEPSPSAPTDLPASSAPTAETPAPAKKEEDVAMAQSSDDEAAATVQRHFRRHLARRNALAKISSLSSLFADRQSSFEKPTSFTFQHPASAPSPSSTATPPLAFGSANSSFLSYEDFLVDLLSKIDAVESGGDRQVKQERKSLVRRVEKELSRLDAMKERAWEQEQLAKKDAQATPAVAESEVANPQTETTSTTEPVVEASSSPSPAVADTSSWTAEISPVQPPIESASAPSPVDDDLEPLLLPSESKPISESAPPSPGLTKEALASLDEPLAPAPSVSAPRSTSGSSTTSSTLTTSSTINDGQENVVVSSDELIAEVLRRAEKLGVEVEKLEAAEGRQSHEEGGFVVV